VGDLSELVKENREILDSITTNLESQVIYTLLDIVFNSDKDGDFYLDPEEDSGLLLRLEAIKGVNFDKELFLKKLNDVDGRSIGSIVKIVENLLNRKIPPEKKVFSFVS